MMQEESELSQPRAPLAGHPAPWSKARLLDIITRSAGATMAVVDRSLTMIYVNDEYARWFGTVPDSLTGKSLVEVYGEPECLRFMPFVERVLRGERVQYQRLLRTPYGFDEWRTICLTPWHGDDGGVDGFITTALDVHELQVTMNALRTANQRLSSHMENSPLAVLEMDHDLQLLRCSQRAVQLMGWLQVAGLEGRLVPELLALPEDGELLAALRRLQSGEESQNRAEASFFREDGTEVHCEWFNSALTDADGKVASIMALVQDVSAKIQIARQQHYLAHHDALTTPSRGCTTAPRSRTGSKWRWCRRATARAWWPCFSLTWTDSRASTTRGAIGWAMRCCAQWRSASRPPCARATPRPGWAATSPSSCWTATSPAR